MDGGLIRKNVQFLQGKVNEYQKLIKEWQAECSHEIVEGSYGANTGNWCPQDDSYWISAKCLDCGENLHAESGTALYQKLSMSGMISREYEPKQAIEERTKLRMKIEQERQNA